MLSESYDEQARYTDVSQYIAGSEADEAGFRGGDAGDAGAAADFYAAGGGEAQDAAEDAADLRECIEYHVPKAYIRSTQII